ncbi:MAG: hypothetical protein EB828_00315 [Nitrosopumilus sp. D6]|nr:MAG: hypothetical protein EB828_00315 [Nitrosopumilus sp. D6]
MMPDDDRNDTDVDNARPEELSDEIINNIYPPDGTDSTLTKLAKEEAELNRKHQKQILVMLMLFMTPWLLSTYGIVLLVALGHGNLSDYVLGTLI